MKTFNTFLTESVEKNLHLEHIEDLVFSGVSGVYSSFRFLKSLRDMLAGNSKNSTVNLTTKWDGFPKIIAGINPENRRFFVGINFSRLNYTWEDIDRNHPEEELNKKLKVALDYLPDLGMTGILQGDMMFMSSDLKNEKIGEDEYVTFQPSSVVYAIPSDSNLAKQIKQAKLGIIWHTAYHGQIMSDLRVDYDISVSNLRTSKNVWYRDASFVDVSGTASFTISETQQVDSLLRDIESLLPNIPSRILNKISSTNLYKRQIRDFMKNREKISDTTNHVVELIRWVENKMNQAVLEVKKPDAKQRRLAEKNEVMRFYTLNHQILKRIFDLQNLIIEVKNIILGKLNDMKQVPGTFVRTENGFKVTSPEGFVCIDKLDGSAIKLVDRLEFSKTNFQTTKAWNR